MIVGISSYLQRKMRFHWQSLWITEIVLLSPHDIVALRPYIYTLSLLSLFHL